MRLIDTETLEQHEFFDSQVPEYAILSHCWSENEISLAQYQAARDRTGSSFSKIVQCCELARSHPLNLKWAWIDTCCIDKKSSAELSEAINSMYNWYQRAEVCYVFLEDYDSTLDNQRQSSDSADAKINSRLSKCKWFTRGWTLQELVASRRVLFYDMNGIEFGTKTSLVGQLSSITRVDVPYLDGTMSPQEASVACRMSWASYRRTSRPEDIAYCLLGLFDVNMPLLYGEGDRKAFVRLQGAIISQIDDESVFAWKSTDNETPRGLLADHPNEFATSGNIIVDRTLRITLPAPRLSSRGIEWCIPRRKHRFSMEVGPAGCDSMWNPVQLELACRPANREGASSVLISREDFNAPFHRSQPAVLLSFINRTESLLRRLAKYHYFSDNAVDSIIISQYPYQRKLRLECRPSFTLEKLVLTLYYRIAIPACLIGGDFVCIRYGNPMLTWTIFTTLRWLLPSDMPLYTTIYFLTIWAAALGTLETDLFLTLSDYIHDFAPAVGYPEWALLSLEHTTTLISIVAYFLPFLT
ncbi:Vegetative incompatibility protein HET-E-1 [Pseudocercospora fuligena]|uniref:Vegetative incompatibility protein HET-E-1 n=1 Tax=Pseudocercospora fuligena TaxID=685502 RepID=A0A8H6RUK8_9PEZI|nr:Vegetative incompatibility protein HET-E-1 [Pseudocercospora fuligena]